MGAGYLTEYDGLVCSCCAEERHGMTAVSREQLCEEWGYDLAACEECAKTLYDGLADADRREAR